jgi:hypothetical protein
MNKKQILFAVSLAIINMISLYYIQDFNSPFNAVSLLITLGTLGFIPAYLMIGLGGLFGYSVLLPRVGDGGELSYNPYLFIPVYLTLATIMYLLIFKFVAFIINKFRNNKIVK